METKRSYTADYLKAFAAILVVAGHCTDYINHNFISYDPLHMKIRMIIYAVHVPLFFIVAGYFSHEKDLKTYYVQKFNRIFIPFLFFTTLKLIYNIAISDEFAHGSALSDQLLKGYGYGELYWFSYAILWMCFIMPLLWNHKKACYIVLTCVLIFVIMNTQLSFVKIPTFFQIQRTILYFPFFLGGFLIKEHWEKLSKVLSRFRIILFIGSIAITAFIVLQFKQQIRLNFPIAYIAAICMALVLFYIASLIPKKQKVLSIIAKYTYQIFFLDSFYRVILFTVLKRYLNIHYYDAYIVTIIVLILSCITCCIVQYIPGLRFLFGINAMKKTAG